MLPGAFVLAWQSQIYVVPEHRLLLCAIHKSGSTAWINLVRKMTKLSYRNASNPEFSPHLPSDRRHPPTLAGYNASAQAEMLVDNSWLKFATVRDPAVRLESAWKQKIRDMGDVPAMLRQYARDLRLDDVAALRNVSFETFVTRLVTKLPRVNDHFQLQYHQCGFREHLTKYNIVDVTRDIMLNRTFSHLMQLLRVRSLSPRLLEGLEDAILYAAPATHSTHAVETSSNQSFHLRGAIHRAYAEDFALLSVATSDEGRACGA